MRYPPGVSRRDGTVAFNLEEILGGIRRKHVPLTKEKFEEELELHRKLKEDGKFDAASWDKLYRRGSWENIERATADNTWSNRATAYGHWTRYCTAKGLKLQILWAMEGGREEMAEVKLVMQEFLTWLTLDVRGVLGPGRASSGTIEGYARHVVKLHDLVGINISFVNNIITQFCKGRAKRLVDVWGPRIKAKKNGFVVPQFQDWEKIDWRPHLGRVNPARRRIVIRALYQSMFGCHWRRSDATIGAGLEWRKFWSISRKNLRWFDLQANEIALTKKNLISLRETRKGYAWVRSPPGKNDPTGEGATARFPSILPLQSKSWFCPGMALLELEIDNPCAVEDREDTPLFMDPETGSAFLTKDFDTIIVYLIRAALCRFHNQDFSEEEVRKFFSLHSFRIGAENALRSTKAPKHVLMMAGRWLSEAFLEYGREEVDEMLGFMQQMQEAEGVLITGRPDDVPLYAGERALGDKAGFYTIQGGEQRELLPPAPSISTPSTEHPLQIWMGKDFKIVDTVVPRAGEQEPSKIPGTNAPRTRQVFCRLSHLDLKSDKPITLRFRDPRTRPDRKLTLTEWAALEPGIRTKVPGSNRFQVGGESVVIKEKETIVPN